jgi:hypothetical protein
VKIVGRRKPAVDIHADVFALPASVSKIAVGSVPAVVNPFPFNTNPPGQKAKIGKYPGMAIA